MEEIDMVTIEERAKEYAELLKKSAWEKEAQINHDDEANYKQGYHDAINKACALLKAVSVLTDDDSIMGFIKAMEEYNMGYKQMYGQTFHSKREFFKWIEEHKDEIDWDEDVELGWYYKEEDEDEE